MHATRPRLRRWARVAGHLLLAAVCLEAAARVDDALTFGAPLIGRYDGYELRGEDADGLRRNVPGARFQKWRLDRYGFRGSDFPLQKPPGRVRVVVLGQSESFGLYESDGHEWPARLGALLRFSHPEVEVLNASVVGPGRRTRLAYLERVVLPLAPDVVVLYANPLFDATAREAPLRLAPLPPGTPLPPVRPDAGPRLASRVGPKLWQRLRDVLPASLADPGRAWLAERRLAQRERAATAPVLDAIRVEDVRGLQEHLGAVIDLLRSQGVMPVLATYPSLLDRSNRTTLHPELTNLRAAWVEFSEEALLDAFPRLNAAVEDVAREHGVLLVDAAGAVPRSRRFFGDHYHYTDEGAERVAEAFATALRGSGLLD